jgi:hypothetical protein
MLLMTGILPGSKLTCGKAAVLLPAWKPKMEVWVLNSVEFLIYSDRMNILNIPLVMAEKLKVTFSCPGNATKVVESFEAEETNSVEMQQGGWQAILDTFKKYTEAN